MSKFYYTSLAKNGEDFCSTAINFVAYDEDTSTMLVSFINTDAEYMYAGVTESTYNLFVGADSVGRFYQQHISGRGDSYRVYDEELVSRKEEELLDTLETVATSDTKAVLGEPVYHVIYWRELESGSVFAPVFHVSDLDSALAQFHTAMKNADDVLGRDTKYKITAVTTHFE